MRSWPTGIFLILTLLRYKNLNTSTDGIRCPKYSRSGRRWQWLPQLQLQQTLLSPAARVKERVVQERPPRALLPVQLPRRQRHLRNQRLTYRMRRLTKNRQQLKHLQLNQLLTRIQTLHQTHPRRAQDRPHPQRRQNLRWKMPSRKSTPWKRNPRTRLLKKRLKSSPKMAKRKGRRLTMLTRRRRHLWPRSKTRKRKKR
ncbi:unnamed protein product [Nesidiocoris tenuis]|uniref:Uncharacterized protein n=1 Tax=Nesidiocoris tenuis TaxID=355587 RepID=A0A6H5GI10_9HEMI|nr:unnamed protein product [Nesidiocoris tenuis]